MNTPSRRQFLSRVGQGMLIAGVGSAFAEELGISTAIATEAPARLTFGDAEPLVSLLQETPADKLQPLLAEKLKRGNVDLRQLVKAASLANARTFAGEDYIGMHTLMALKPAWLMSQQLPANRQPLSVLKVLYRNTSQIQALGGSSKERLRPVARKVISARENTAQMLHDAVRGERADEAEQILAAIAGSSPDRAFNELMHVVEDGIDVHRIVFAHRSWDVLDLAGRENAETLLRQSLRYCLKNEKWTAARQSQPRTMLPKLLDEYALLSRPPAGSRAGDDAWVEELSKTIFEATPQQAAAAVAAALKENMSPKSIGEAISLAANQLVLRDAGRTEKMVRPGKPVGSTHGDSIGVHAQDSANAWRKIAEVSNHRNTMACLILAGYQVARDRSNRGGKFLEWKPRPHTDELAKIKAKSSKALLRELDGAIRENDQDRACAVAHQYGTLGHKARPAFDLLLRYATSEDGALHAEKHFITSSLDFADTRPAFRWRHLTGLARVTASEYGQPAPGYAQACELLGVKA
jgi:hypothetical protein